MAAAAYGTAFGSNGYSQGDQVDENGNPKKPVSPIYNVPNGATPANPNTVSGLGTPTINYNDPKVSGDLQGTGSASGGFTGLVTYPGNSFLPGEPNPAQTPGAYPTAGTTSASATGSQSTTGPQNGDYQGWFQNLMGGANDQATLLSHKAELEAAGYHISPANASGEITKIQTPDGQWVRVIGNGEGHPVWIPQGSGSSSSASGSAATGGAPSFAELLNVPQAQAGQSNYTPTDRNYNASDILNNKGTNAGREQSLLDLLNGIATGSRSESSNKNFQIDPNDPIIKNQVDAYDASQQRSTRNSLDALAERAGTHANLGAETRHAAESAGQATGAFQAGLIGQELTARRQEAEQSLQLYSQYMTADQQRQAQMQIEQLRNAEQSYEFNNSQAQNNSQFNASLGQNNSQFNAAQLQAARQFAANLGQNAFQFGSQQQYLNSPLNG